MDEFIRILDIVVWPLVAVLAMHLFRKDMTDEMRRLVKNRFGSPDEAARGAAER